MNVDPSLGFVSLRSLLEQEGDDIHDNIIFSRIKELAASNLPEGWLSWKVHVLTREDILGTQADPQILNKLRFALSTVGLARAFAPNCSSLSERTYRDIKLKLLSWPLCVGLIIGPSSVTSRIRGSTSQNDLVLAALADLKALLLSREEASRALANCEEEDADVRSFASATSRSKKTRSSRLDKLERSQAAMKSLLESLESHVSDDEGYQASQLAPPPSSSSLQWIPPASPMEEDFDFAPKTYEQEPSVPPPKPHIASQGISCQRLGELSFRQIRYTDVQKKLHAAPVFSALKINPVLSKSLGIPSPSHDLLAKMDQTLGTVVHGLLLQREALSTCVKDLSDKHPSLKQDIASAFSTGSSFRAVSDDLLQYACGRRAETIEQRSNSLLPKEEYLATRLNSIPPSSTHLFCEDRLAELLKQPPQNPFFSPPINKAASDEYAFTTEEEDRLLQGSEEGFVDDETTSEASWPKANQQATNLSAVQEPSVTEKKNESIKAKPSIQPEFQPCRKQLNWDCYQPVPVCLRLEDCGYEPERSINDSYKMIANNPDATVPCSSEWTIKAIKNLKVTCTDRHRTFEATCNTDSDSESDDSIDVQVAMIIMTQASIKDGMINISSERKRPKKERERERFKKYERNLPKEDTKRNSGNTI
nr:unnamed protein product [Callosobruchus chinensis]